MVQMIESLTLFENFWPSLTQEDFNLFLGAGISRDAPTNGPIWTEMQAGFLSAVFDRMEAEKWPIASHFPKDRVAANKFNIRPEVFWRQMIEMCGSLVIGQVLEAANVGCPNLNHIRIANLLANRCCKVAMTTNFDEHIESVLPQSVQIEVPSKNTSSCPIDRSVYIKLHGTVSDGTSLSYTLEQYDDLKDRNNKIIQKMLSTKPLIIAGYSGYDTDVCPALQMVSQAGVYVIIIKHPGSSPEQPIFELATEGSNTYVLEATCNEVFSILTNKLDDNKFHRKKQRQSKSTLDIYRDSCKQILMPYCPFLLSSAANLAGNWQIVHRYAWLSHDACCDERYRDIISEEEYRDIHLKISYMLKLCGDTAGSHIALNEAKTSIDKSGGKLSEAINALEAEAMTQNAPNQFNNSNSDDSSRTLPFKPSAVLQLRHFLMETFGKEPSEKDYFLTNWKIGIAKRREKAPLEAVHAFERSAAVVLKNVVTHLERGRFFCDYAGALYDLCLQERCEERQKQANILYQASEKITREIGDWTTNAKALLMLARLVLVAGQLSQARTNAEAALEAVLRTKDYALKDRIEKFLGALSDLEKEASDFTRDKDKQAEDIGS